MDDTDTVWVCPKGHRFRGRVTITIAEDTPCFEAMPYAGDFCSVCYFAFIATVAIITTVLVLYAALIAALIMA